MSQNECFNRGKDIWLRSRTNALANKIAADQIQTSKNITFFLETIFIVLPIAAVSLSLLLVTAGNSQDAGTKAWVIGLNITSIISNSGALFISIVKSHFSWDEKLAHYNYMQSSYQLIAQKARRLENPNLVPEEAQYLCRQLEETFELYKAMGNEPNYKIFQKAQKVLSTFNALPFNLQDDDVNKTVK